MDRRTFLTRAAATAGFAAAVRRQTFAQASPNETVNVAVVGIRGDNRGRPVWTSRGRGQDLYAALSGVPNVRISHVVDIDERHLSTVLPQMRQQWGGDPKTETDSRKWQDLNAEIAEGHLSTSLCHLGNISYRVGRSLMFDPGTERFSGDAAADALLARSYRAPYVVADVV
jgi:hypothetical protein